MKTKKYVTNSIPYVNAPPHIGHALEFVQSDTIARYWRLMEHQVLYLCGSDDNALKNVQAAAVTGVPVETFVKKHAQRFVKLAQELDVQFDIFQAGMDTKHHYPASQKLWQLCAAGGDIYKKEYEGLYCVGCETFYTASELDKNGECFEHPGRPLETVAETNYFFKLSKYQKQLVGLISTDKLRIIPQTRKNEILSFLKEPLHDISISRTNARAHNWGVPVPGDESQRMYVWFDALNIYQSGIGFSWDEAKYHKWWPADVHVIGKGIARFHAVYWPAFLLSAGLAVPRALFVHGYLTLDGKKMSKTLGNVIDPTAIIKKYGTDATRYYLLREVPAYDDGDYSDSRHQQLYQADLANELGNLLVRLTTLAQQDALSVVALKPTSIYTEQEQELFESYQFHLVLESIFESLRSINKRINEEAPWNKPKAARASFLTESLQELNGLGSKLLPFLPSTAKKIISHTTGPIKKASVLFPRRA